MRGKIDYQGREWVIRRTLYIDGNCYLVLTRPKWRPVIVAYCDVSKKEASK